MLFISCNIILSLACLISSLFFLTNSCADCIFDISSIASGKHCFSFADSVFSHACLTTGFLFFNMLSIVSSIIFCFVSFSHFTLSSSCLWYFAFISDFFFLFPESKSTKNLLPNSIGAFLSPNYDYTQLIIEICFFNKILFIYCIALGILLYS